MTVVLMEFTMYCYYMHYAMPNLSREFIFECTSYGYNGVFFHCYLHHIILLR